MPETITLSSPAATDRGMRALTATLHEAGFLLVMVLDGKKGFQVQVLRLSRSQFTVHCNCGKSHICTHTRFVHRLMHGEPRLSSWLTEGRVRHTTHAESESEHVATAGNGKTIAGVKSRRTYDNPKENSKDKVGATLPDDVASWLQQIAATLKPADPTLPSAKPRPQARRVALFLLTLSPASDGLVIECWQGEEKKTGGYSPKKRIPLSTVARGGTSRLPHQDLGLVAAVRGYSSNGWSESATLMADATALVLALLETGRCSFEAFDAGPLTLGPERNGRPIWEVGPSGEQSPAIDIDGGGVPIWLESTWYLDPVTNQFGPLRFSIPEATARTFFKGPAVQPTTAKHLANTKDAGLVAIGLPAPRSLEIIHLSAGVPEKRLKLITFEVPRGVFQPPMHQDAVLLTFRYGPHAVAAHDPKPEFVTADDTSVTHLKRDFEAEAAAAAELFHLGLLPLAETVPMRDRREVQWKLGKVVFENTFGLPVRPSTSTDKAWSDFLSTTRPKLLAEGWKLEIDTSFRHAVQKADSWYCKVTPQPGSGWFDLELGVKLGAERINLLPALLQVIHQPELIQQITALAAAPSDSEFELKLQDGSKLLLSVRRLHRMLAAVLEMQVNGRAVGGTMQLMDLMISDITTLEPELESMDWNEALDLRALAKRLNSFESVERVKAPKGLKAELRPYQLDGLCWLQFLRAHGLCGILADDMGLGKTVQTLAHVLTEKASGRLEHPCLVVSPTSVIHNWVAEAARFAPKLKVLVLHGARRSKSFAEIAGADLVLTTYPLVLRDIEMLQEQPFHLLVLDEAQAIKNARAKIARDLRKIEARHRLCLTGTPLENNLAELWAQFDFLMPGVLGDAHRFGRVYRKPIEKDGDGERQAALVRRIRPFILRRTKSNVAKELPPKTEIVQSVELGSEQQDLYESIRLSVHQRVVDAIREKGLAQAQIVILDALLKLRQVCCDPRLVKLAAAKEVKDSAKLDALLELLSTLLSEGRRVLLFSQFTSMLSLIEKELNERKILHVKLTGETKDRKTPAARFQKGEVPLFLISLKAGGTGLNLTAADTIIHYDPWWNPAAEQQATDRAHRIGQDKPVFVYKLIARGSVEERISRLQERKRALAAGILDDGGRQGVALTREDVESLFAEIAVT